MNDPTSKGEDALEALVLECLDRWESQGESALDALCRDHPSFASRLQSRMRVLRNAGLLPDASPPAAFPEKLGDFKLVASLGGGGMGVVYRAVQESLGREVALKLIRPEQLYFPGARERFRREVETVARLQHPGIVPIYTVGDERGLPYFAMELVEGASLADVLAKVQEREPAELDGSDVTAALPPARDGESTGAIFDGAWVDVVARIVREVAEALEHAHRRGVLHRDLKPSNVMITRAGRVLLLDFGLASREGVDRVTKTGSQVGTLHYLAPEQIDGGAAAIERRSDVYSLGVTLYELLALVPPFRAGNASDLFQRILAGESEPLRARNAAVGVDLATVCATAIERAPERRYASAADFARDLSNVLERRPIDARRAGPLERLSRWAQRKPAHATAAALALALVVGGPSALYFQQRAANARIAQANEELKVAVADATTQRDLAQQNLDVAGDAIERMLGRVGHKDLEGVPQVEVVRTRLLEDALELQKKLASGASAGGLADWRVAAARARLGSLLARLDREEEALSELDASIASLRAVATSADLPATAGDSSPRETLADALVYRARSLRDVGRHDESLRDDLEALAIYADVPMQRRDLVIVNARAHAAGTSFHLGRAKEAIALQTDAMLAARDLCARSPLRENREQLAAIVCTLGYMRMHKGEIEAAVAALREAVDMHGELLADGSSSPTSRKSLVDALVNLSAISIDAQDFAAAEVDARRALDVQTSLVRDFPSTPPYRAALNDCRANLVVSLRASGDAQKLAEADELETELLAEQRALVEQSPAQQEYRETYAIALGNAASQRMVRDPARAIELFEAAIAQGNEILRQSPGRPIALKNRANQCFGLAQTHVLQNRAKPALAATRDAVATMPGDWLTLRRAASKHLQVKTLAPNDTTLSPSEREEIVKAASDEAFALYSRAVEAGFADVMDAEHEPEITSLRENPAWPALVERVRAAAARQQKL